MIRDLASLGTFCVFRPAAVVQRGGHSADGQQHQTGQKLHISKCRLTEATETQVTELGPDTSSLRCRTARSTTRWRSTTRLQLWSDSCGEETTGSVLLHSSVCLSVCLSLSWYESLLWAGSGRVPAVPPEKQRGGPEGGGEAPSLPGREALRPGPVYRLPHE